MSINKKQIRCTRKEVWNTKENVGRLYKITIKKVADEGV